MISLNKYTLPYVKFIIDTYSSSCTIELFAFVAEIVTTKGTSFIIKSSCRYVTVGTGMFYGINYLDEKVGLASAASFKLQQIVNNDYSGTYIAPKPDPLFPKHLEQLAYRSEKVIFNFVGIDLENTDKVLQLQSDLQKFSDENQRVVDENRRLTSENQRLAKLYRNVLEEDTKKTKNYLK